MFDLLIWLTQWFHFPILLAADKWMEGTGSDALEGGDDANTIDDKVTASLQNPLDRLLTNYRSGCTVAYASASTVTVGIGECTLQDTGDTIRRMRKVTSAITVDIMAVR